MILLLFHSLIQNTVEWHSKNAYLRQRFLKDAKLQILVLFFVDVSRIQMTSGSGLETCLYYLVVIKTYKTVLP